MKTERVYPISGLPDDIRVAFAISEAFRFNADEEHRHLVCDLPTVGDQGRRIFDLLLKLADELIVAPEPADDEVGGLPAQIRREILNVWNSIPPAVWTTVKKRRRQ